jgi:hypothetical protein
VKAEAESAIIFKLKAIGRSASEWPLSEQHAIHHSDDGFSKTGESAEKARFSNFGRDQSEPLTEAFLLFRLFILQEFRVKAFWLAHG